MLLATTHTGYGGAPRVIATLANRWSEAGRRVLIASLGRRQEGFYPLAPAVLERWLGVAGRSESKWAAVERSRAAIRAIRCLIVEENVRVVIGFGPRPTILAYLAARRLPVATVGAVRSDPGRNDPGPLWRWLVRRTYSRVAALVVQTTAARDHFPPPIARRARVIPNAVWDTKLGTAATLEVGDRGERQVVALGRLSEEKGYDLLIQAFSRIADQNPEWRLTIWGEGRARGPLERLVEECGLGGRVRLPGSTAAPADALCSGDLFVMPSRFEGFPNALLEAMAVGLPVVSFDCPSGPAEIVRDGVDGILVPEQDVGALAEAMQGLMRNHAARERLGSEASSVRDRFAPERIFAMWDEIVAPLMSRASDSRNGR